MTQVLYTPSSVFISVVKCVLIASPGFVKVSFSHFSTIGVPKSRCHDLPKRTRTDRNGRAKIPKWTSMGTETDWKRTLVGTESLFRSVSVPTEVRFSTHRSLFQYFRMSVSVRFGKS